MKDNKEIEAETAKNVDALKKAIGNNFVCPICHNNQFVVVNGYIRHDIQTDMNSFIMGSSSAIPTMVLVCNTCGFMSQHAIGILKDVK